MKPNMMLRTIEDYFTYNILNFEIEHILLHEIEHVLYLFPVDAGHPNHMMCCCWPGLVQLLGFLICL